jgi:hypothetical protein
MDEKKAKVQSGTTTASFIPGSLSVTGSSSLDNGNITTDGAGSLTTNGGFYLGNQGVIMQIARVTVPSSTILGMTGTGATDAVILSAAPAGQFYLVSHIALTLQFNTTAYTTTATDFAFYYTNGSTRFTPATGTAAVTPAFMTSTASTVTLVGAVTNGNLLASSSLHGTSLTFGPTTSSTSVSTGNSPITVTVLYVITV